MTMMHNNGWLKEKKEKQKILGGIVVVIFSTKSFKKNYLLHIAHESPQNHENQFLRNIMAISNLRRQFLFLKNFTRRPSWHLLVQSKTMETPE